jgi:hypothetical protein
MTLTTMTLAHCSLSCRLLKDYEGSKHESLVDMAREEPAVASEPLSASYINVTEGDAIGIITIEDVIEVCLSSLLPLATNLMNNADALFCHQSTYTHGNLLIR